LSGTQMSGPLSGAAIHRLLMEARTRLIQGDSRNKLIHTPRDVKRSKSLNIVDTTADQIFQLLYRQRSQMDFLPAPEATSVKSLPANANLSTKLQTQLTSEDLQKRLLTLFRDAKTLEEEQGVNVLYLAVGFLRWFENDNSDIAREAPLILVPVSLVRNVARSSFRLISREDDVTVNFPLQERLREFGISLPNIPDTDDWRTNNYFSAVREAISAQPRWSIDENGIVLGFYSFSKFLMFRDLDPANWPSQSILNHPLVTGLLVDGFPHSDPIFSDDVPLDETFDPADLLHVVDADASQTIAIETVRKERNLVIQGPPGTGKSQTITNIIAAAVHDGKKVLFVAEKMAALEVVHRRLVEAKLGDMCLELHSRKANKRAVIQEIDRTRRAADLTTSDGGSIKRLRDMRDYLNANAKALHVPLMPSGVTPFQALGEQVKFAEQGYPAPTLAIDNISQLTEENLRALVEDIKRLVRLTTVAGSKHLHPWRGMQALTLQPTDLARLRVDLTAFAKNSQGYTSALKIIGAALGFPDDRKLGEVEEILNLLRRIAKYPDISHPLLMAIANTKNIDRLVQLAAFGKRFLEFHSAMAGTFLDPAWKFNFDTIRQAIAAGSDSWLIRMRRPYRRASKQLLSLVSKPLPKRAQDRVKLIDMFIAAREARAEIERSDVFGRTVLGNEWQGLRTNFAALADGLTWSQAILKSSIKSSLPLCVENRVGAGKLAAVLETLSTQFVAGVNKVFSTLNIDLPTAFNVQSESEVPLQLLTERALRWEAEFGRIQEWMDLARADRILRENGGAVIAEALATAKLSPERAVGTFIYARAEALWKIAVERDPSLTQMNGEERSQCVREFCKLEKGRRTIVASDIRARHRAMFPTGGTGEMAIILGETARQRGHLPIRKLVQKAGNTLQLIKPVFLMSPISVAQFLPLGTIEFDLLVIDEASQVRPEDALGVIGRVRQMVIVGDKKQLPPTSFFDRVVDSDDDEDNDDSDEGDADQSAKSPLGGAARATELESILSACEARGMPTRMLQWHYRSRHPSLIAVSNDEFYENRLFLPPSPTILREEVGLISRRVAGSYDRGGKRNNEIEARSVVDAASAHARKTPELSLGIVTFSVSQRDLIDDLLELKRREDHELDVFMQKQTREELFVKNLENVQGDERDAIIISVGYGPRAAGSGLDSMHFGPVSAEGGERRLNVLFTRARVRCEVFVSFASGDIDLLRTTKSGPRVLKHYLRFAETGKLDLPLATGADADSPFEEAVSKFISNLGYPVDGQVGSAGFKIDLGVRNPERSGEYLLAVECDGAAYHSARWARERDRLRQQVLENLGWSFHRIWSTDWFRSPDKAKMRLTEAIETARLRARKSS